MSGRRERERERGERERERERERGWECKYVIKVSVGKYVYTMKRCNNFFLSFFLSFL